MAESTPLRIVMAPKTKRAVALGLAQEAYYNDTRTDEDTWVLCPEKHAENIVKVAEVFLDFLEHGEGD